MLNAILILFGSIALVLVSSLLFINALEWLGAHLKLGSSFVGAILSPVFTSLPELIVIMVALFSTTGDVGTEIGIGTIFGEPFMVSSLSYGLVGIAVIAGYLAKKRNSTTLSVDKTLSLPYIFIIILFPLTLIPGYIHLTWLRYIFGTGFLAGFVFYIRSMYHRRMAELIIESEDLILGKFLPETTSLQRTALVIQIIIAIMMIYFGSRYLVLAVASIAHGIAISPLGLALMIIPAATALPETITALIWAFRGKDTISLGSLVGEKTLYATFYPALGMFLTPWVLDVHAVFSVIATTATSIAIFYLISRKRIPWFGLLTGTILFIIYGILVFIIRI